MPCKKINVEVAWFGVASTVRVLLIAAYQNAKLLPQSSKLEEKGLGNRKLKSTFTQPALKGNGIAF